MEVRIETLQPKKLIGMNMKMSLAENRTRELWQKFMSKRGNIHHRVNSDYISMQVYNAKDKDAIFVPDTIFTKWAVVEVSSSDDVPDNMEFYSLNGGLYAVFIHNGPASAFSGTIQYIFGKWLPESGYTLDSREHFEVLPENYNPLDPNAREEVWIPIK